MFASCTIHAFHACWRMTERGQDLELRNSIDDMTAYAGS